MSEVEVRVLGAVELRIDGLLAPIERVQVRRMLAVLAMSVGNALSIDRLIDELWPGDLPNSPRAAVRVIASRLRAALGARASVLRSSAHEYVLAVEHGAVDARSFEALVTGDRSITRPAVEELAHLDAAFELWRGDPFGGAHGPPVLDRAAVYLDELRLAGAVRRAELLTYLGSPHRAVALLAPLIADDAIDERLWAVHAIALARAGRRTEALDVIGRARRVMRNMHGLEPTEVLAVAERTILVTSEQAAPAELIPAPPTLFGRDRELDDALRWLTTDAHEPRLVLITGAPGSGKSALAATVRARLGWPCVHAHCDPDLSDVEALTTLLGVDDAGPASGDGRSRTIRIVDELVASIAARAGADPFLLVFDDLQWARDIELRTLLRLVRSSTSTNIRIIATMRDLEAADSHPGVEELIAKVEQSGRVSRLELDGLDRDSSRRTYTTWSGTVLSPTDTTTLMELTDGNPYLIRSLAAAKLDLGVARADNLRRLFHDVTVARLDSLPTADEQVLRTAAVLGRTVDTEIVAAVSERTPREVADAIDRAIDVRMLVQDGASVRFDHELTRLGLAADVGPAATAVLHTAATDACRTLGRDPVVVARHLLGAGSLRADGRAATDLLAGADRAAARGRFDEAVRFLRAAAELETDPVRRLDVERQRAWAMECAGDRAGATTLYEEIFATARQGDLPTILGRAALGGVAFGGVVGGDAGRLARLQEALDHPPPDERLHLEIAAAAVAELEAADRAIPAPLLELVASLATDDDASAVRQAVDLRVIRRTPVSTRLLAQVEEHVRSARRTGSLPLILEAEEMVVRARLTRGDLPGAEQARTDLARTVRSNSWPRYVWTVALFDAVLTDLRSGPVAADEPARRALSIGREHGVGDAVNAYSMFRLSVARRDGTLGELEPWIRAAIAGPSPVPAWHAVLAASLAEQRDAAGAMDALVRFWGATGDRLPAFTHIGLALAAHAGRLLGDAATLRACIERLLPWSGNLLVVGAGAACFGPADLALAEAMEAIADDRSPRFREAGERLIVGGGGT